jgi:hypothetical protein
LPKQKGTELENFDRLAGILMRTKPKKKKPAKKVRKPGKTRA